MLHSNIKTSIKGIKKRWTHCSTAWPASYWTTETKDILPQKPQWQHWWSGGIYNADSVSWWQTWRNQYYKMSDRSCQGLQLLNAFVMLETELWLGITGLVILGGNQPQLGSKSCKVEIDGGGVWKRHADQMTTTGVGNGIEDEPVSMAVEPEWRLDRQGDSADQSYP